MKDHQLSIFYQVSVSRMCLPFIPQSHPQFHPHAHTDTQRGTLVAHHLRLIGHCRGKWEVSAIDR